MGVRPLPLGTYSHRLRRGALEKGVGNPKALIMGCESILRIQAASERKRRNNYVFPDMVGMVGMVLGFRCARKEGHAPSDEPSFLWVLPSQVPAVPCVLALKGGTKTCLRPEVDSIFYNVAPIPVLIPTLTLPPG